MRSVIILLAFLTLEVIGYQTINPQPSPMILPLFHSKPNSSRHRRELETNSQARMKLYDDLLTEGSLILTQKNYKNQVTRFSSSYIYIYCFSEAIKILMIYIDITRRSFLSERRRRNSQSSWIQEAPSPTFLAPLATTAGIIRF